MITNKKANTKNHWTTKGLQNCILVVLGIWIFHGVSWPKLYLQHFCWSIDQSAVGGLDVASSGSCAVLWQLGITQMQSKSNIFLVLPSHTFMYIRSPSQRGDTYLNVGGQTTHSLSQDAMCLAPLQSIMKSFCAYTVLIILRQTHFQFWRLPVSVLCNCNRDYDWKPKLSKLAHAAIRYCK